MEPAVELQSIWKRYIRPELKGNSVPVLIRGLLGRERPEDSHFWVLKDVSFTVSPGETFGLVGANGAGKSTILRLIANITRASRGEIQVRGRVGALISLGAGFHRELTGRENIYLNGVILRMTRKEIDRKFDSIIDFAELDEFIDMPVKRYSSGMYARLGFAIAAHMEPNVLLVDEVLAVGDVNFQQKCLRLIRSLTVNNKTSVIFVSHNHYAIQALCQRALWLDRGAVRAIGRSSDVVSKYLEFMASLPQRLPISELPAVDRSHQGGVMGFKSVQLLNGRGEDVNAIEMGDSLRIRAQYESLAHIDRPNFRFHINTPEGVPLASPSSVYQDDLIAALEPGTGYVTCEFPELTLMPAQYTLNLSATSSDGQIYHTRWTNARTFTVVPARTQGASIPMAPMGGDAYIWLPCRIAYEASSPVGPAPGLVVKSTRWTRPSSG